jgi:hypothetical protein
MSHPMTPDVIPFAEWDKLYQANQEQAERLRRKGKVITITEARRLALQVAQVRHEPRQVRLSLWQRLARSWKLTD